MYYWGKLIRKTKNYVCNIFWLECNLHSLSGCEGLAASSSIMLSMGHPGTTTTTTTTCSTSIYVRNTKSGG